jgi:hypothetical protein
MVQRFMMTSLLFILFSLSSSCGWVSESDTRNQCKDTGGTWEVERRTTPYPPAGCPNPDMSQGPVLAPQAIVWRHAYCVCPQGTYYFHEEGCISQQRCDELMQEQ